MRQASRRGNPEDQGMNGLCVPTSVPDYLGNEESQLITKVFRIRIRDPHRGSRKPKINNNIIQNNEEKK